MAAILNIEFKYILFFVILIAPTYSNLNSGSEDVNQRDPYSAIWLNPNEHHLKENDQKFQIFCYKSIPKTMLQIWRSVDLIFETAPLSYDIFPGINESDVQEKYKSHSIWHPSFWISGQKTTVGFPSFSQYCVGIASQDKYTIYLKVRTVNYWKVLQTILGLLFFVSAPSLSRNPFFHYTSAMSLGVLGSLLVLIYIISRFIPRKTTSYAVLLFGYSFVLYIFQMVWKDLNDIISKYMDLLLAYCLIAGFISFLLCYRLGPVQNIRTLNIIQWCMQIIATLLIYLSSEYREVSTAIILILITARSIPTKWIVKFHRIWYRFFPPKIQLITELEFIEQGHIETKKALNHLRQYCNSPDCNAWKTIRKLKDPIRFAEFMDTGRHCTDEELLHYNSEDFGEFESEDSDTELENTRNNYQNCS